MLALASALVSLAVLAGCGAAQTTGAHGRPPRQVARRFAIFYATLAANQDHPATPAQVRALAQTLDAHCSSPRNGQYPCVVHLPGRVPATQGCVAVVSARGAVTGRCGVGADPPPVVTTGYVDCARIGRVVSVVDPPGDVRRVVPLISSERLVAADDPAADLLEVRVAATRSRFCVDFHTIAPLGAGSWLALDVTHRRAPDTGFAPTIDDRRSPVQLDSPVNTPVAGQIGKAGDWTSLVMSADNPSARLPRRPFEFRAVANHEIAMPGDPLLTTDAAPDAPRSATYP